jgi:hypothetical protein
LIKSRPVWREAPPRRGRASPAMLEPEGCIIEIRPLSWVLREGDPLGGGCATWPGPKSRATGVGRLRETLRGGQPLASSAQLPGPAAFSWGIPTVSQTVPNEPTTPEVRALFKRTAQTQELNRCTPRGSSTSTTAPRYERTEVCAPFTLLDRPGGLQPRRDQRYRFGQTEAGTPSKKARSPISFERSSTRSAT